MKGTPRKQIKLKENQKQSSEKKEKIKKKKNSEYEPKWTLTEIYNEGLGIDIITYTSCKHLITFRTGRNHRQLFTPHGNHLLCALCF